jgi:uncharacterized membrane protein
MQIPTIKLLKLIWYAILAYAVYLMIQLSLPYTAFKPGVDFLASKQRTYRIDYWRVAFYLHVFTSVFALIAGLTQFNKKVLYQFPKIHRGFGLVYWITVLFIAAPTGFIMGIHANGGFPARTSFVLLSFLWFIFTLMAVVQVKKRNFTSHAEWMLRSYALTLSAITLRFYAYLFDVFNIHVRPQEVYMTIAWLSWVPNILIAEALIKTCFIGRLLKKESR